MSAFYWGVGLYKPTYFSYKMNVNTKLDFLQKFSDIDFKLQEKLFKISCNHIAFESF